MNATRHLYAIGAILTILTAASFGTARLKAGPGTSTNVIVSNASNQPVPTKDATLAGRTPITIQSASLTIADGTAGTGYVPIYTVPAGKRLIIQTMYGTGQSDQFNYIDLGVMKVVGASGTHVFPLPFESKQVSTAQSGEAEYVLQNVSLEVDPNSSISVAMTREMYSGVSYVQAGFSGYLENAS